MSDKGEQLGRSRNHVPIGAVATITHGVRSAYYSNRGDGTQWAIMECLCGETVTGQTDSWESAGYELDVHISNTTRNGGNT